MSRHLIELEFDAMKAGDAPLVFDWLWDMARKIEFITDVTLTMDTEVREA